MKKIAIIFAAVLVLSATLFARAFAAPKTSQPKTVHPFEGTFSGYARGDRNSRAPVTIELDQVGNEVTGKIALGSGLFVDGGFCGAGYLPSTVQLAEGEVSGRQIEAKTKLKVSGTKVSVDLEGQLSSDGETIEAEVRVDIPWFCGSDPVISAYLVKEL